MVFCSIIFQKLPSLGYKICDVIIKTLGTPNGCLGGKYKPSSKSNEQCIKYSIIWWYIVPSYAETFHHLLSCIISASLLVFSDNTSNRTDNAGNAGNTNNQKPETIHPKPYQQELQIVQFLQKFSKVHNNKKIKKNRRGSAIDVRPLTNFKKKLL